MLGFLFFSISFFAPVSCILCIRLTLVPADSHHSPDSDTYKFPYIRLIFSIHNLWTNLFPPDGDIRLLLVTRNVFSFA